MKGKRTSIEIKTRVIEEKINNPSMSSRDIEAKLKLEGIEVSNDTVCDILNTDLPQVATESVLISNLVDRNNNLQCLADSQLFTIFKDPKDLKATDLIAVRESAFKQNRLISEKSTENLGIAESETLNLLNSLLDAKTKRQKV